MTKSQSQPPHVLVTGATGFVGRALLERLARERVRLSVAVREGARGERLPPGIAAVSVPPLSDRSDYSAALGGVDVVIHLAARVHVMRDSSPDPLGEFRAVNLHGTERLALQAADAGVRRLVLLSTVKVHGEETTVPYREDSPLSPLDPYGRSKAEGEAALLRVAAERGVEAVVVRSPLVYGPGVKANFLQLMEVASRGIPLPFASLGNRRSLVYAGNLADALTLCALHPDAAGETFLVSDGEDLSTPELLRRISRALGVPCRLFPCPSSLLRLAGRCLGKSRAAERLLGSLQVDGSKIRRVLGWGSPFTVEQGLERTALWFRTQGGGPGCVSFPERRAGEGKEGWS